MRKFTFCLLALVFCSLNSFSENLIKGWDGNGVSGTGSEPNKFGWSSASASDVWAEALAGSRGVSIAYRDDFPSSGVRSISRGIGKTLFYEMNLTGKKFYQFSAMNRVVNNGFTTTFAIIDANNVILGSQTKNLQSNAIADFSFSFSIPIDGTYRLKWSETGGNDRTAAYNLNVIEVGNALTVTFNTDGGSNIAPQFTLEGSDGNATKPATEPTKAGYVFKGWYADESLLVEYDFSQVVTADVTIYAKWEDIKEELKALITRVTTLKEGGTTIGKTYLQTAIDAAQNIVDNNSATTESVTNEFNALTAAVSVYQDTRLSDLKVNDVTITGFLPTTHAYTYIITSNATIPSVSAISSDCAVVEVVDAINVPGTTTVTVTAGNGTIQVYTISININLMAGWDANGSVTSSPYDAGWRTTDANITWTSTPGDGNQYQYRDNLGVGRTFMHPQNSAIFSYPVVLKEGKIYSFSCSSSKMSGNNPRSTTFAINEAADGTKATLGSDNNAAAKWGSYTNHSFSFVAPTADTYYMTWQTQESDGDRSLAFNFILVESGNAYKVTFDTNGGSEAPASQYVLNDGNAKITEPTDPTHDSDTFLGWFENLSSDTVWSFDANTVKGDITLYAKWQESTSALDAQVETTINIISVEGGVKVTSNQSININIVSVIGQKVVDKQVNAGDTFIELSKGLYILNGRKIIVQ